MDTKRAIIYARVSVLDLNPQNQITPLLKHAEHLGFEVVDELVDYASGTKADRPELNKALDKLKKSEADVLLVYSIDRLGRSVSHLIKVVDDLRRYGKGVVILRENLNLFGKDPQSEFTLTLFAALGQYEQALIASRTKNALAVAKAKGTKLGRPVKCTPELTSKVLELAKQGMSIRVIAKELGVVSRSSVQAILKRSKVET
ncbi:recombinase family protein [Bdellovibrio sp. ZAP7]|uniref:recombinase family protein n=1 Tax=Bdellovibrio sp. ZAP7 TaxID=2231053 RepID=UPI001158C796|nr:recombinase family protein [Bdellovibrio sp. ZAP7]QDK47314.1 recombinase family protein [Bdellovibrio sp. ZAP7]